MIVFITLKTRAKAANEFAILLFAVVSLMNGKYKWILNESRRLHEAGVAPAVCDKILYEHAIELVSTLLLLQED